MAFSPPSPGTRPAMEAVMMTLDGDSFVALAVRSGKNLGYLRQSRRLASSHQKISGMIDRERKLIDLLLDCVKDTLHVKVHDFRKGVLGMRLKLLSPCGASVRE